jgi:hypothetical protein
MPRVEFIGSGVSFRGYGFSQMVEGEIYQMITANHTEAVARFPELFEASELEATDLLDEIEGELEEVP